ncbi:MAG: serine hydrolase, partial [Gammaproteobacteria bacterium]|nr:serine hydrolase [Gammaproteobacteria bacterium]
LVEFIAALAEGKVVSSDSFEQMLAGGWYNPETRWHYGYGLFVDNRRRGFSHAGLWPGYRTYVRHCLLNGTTVSVQTNRDGKVDLRGIADRINPCLP